MSHLSNETILEMIRGELAIEGPIYKLAESHLRGCAECQSNHNRLLADFAAEHRIPENLGTQTDHRLVRLIGRGGLGMVFAYEDKVLGRQVAIKLINSKIASPRAISRFKREYDITSSLEHSGVCPVFGIGETPTGNKFYLMRYIRNENFSKVISAFHRSRRKGQLNRKDLAFTHLVDQFISVARTIDFAHSKGIIHRDIKPANIVIDEGNTPIVLDWGLAKRLSDKELCDETSKEDNETPPSTMHLPLHSIDESHEINIQKRQSGPVSAIVEPLYDVQLQIDSTNGSRFEGGQLDTPVNTPSREDGNIVTIEGKVGIGTPSYWSPEQSNGSVQAVDQLSDVFCLGSTLFHVLTGSSPFETKQEAASDFDLLTKFKSIDRRGDIPRSLIAICIKAMAKHKAGRYQSICDLVEDLDSWKRDSKVRCYEESLLEKFMRITRNHIALVVSLLFTVILVSTTVGIAARINLQIINERNRITKNALNTAEEAHGKASNLNIQLLEAKVSAEENLRRLALTANDASKTLIEYGSSRYASGKLKLACIDFFRAWKLRSESGAHVDAYASLLQGHLTRQGASPIIVRHGSDISAIAVSPDDSCFATIADDNIVRLWDLSTGMPIGKPLAHEATLSCITFSRDSKKLATGTYSNKVQIWDVEKCEPITPPRKHSVFAGTIARMILAMIGELISEWEPDVGSYIRGEWYGDSDAYIKFLRFSSDDQTLISYSTDRNLRFWNVDSRASTLRSVMFRNEIDWVELDSILNRAIVSSFSGVFVYDCRTGRRLGRATDQPVKGVTSVASIAGKNLYAFSGPQLSNDSDDSREQSGLVNFWRCDSRRKTGNSLNVGREVDAMYATPDGKRLLVICDTEYLSTGTLPAQAQLWDLRTYKAIGKPISSWSMGSVIGSRNSYNSMVSEDGMTAAIVFENSAKLISTTSGEELYFPFVQDDAITAFAFTFDSTRVVIGSADGCARVWLIPRLDRSHAFLQPNQKYFPMLDDGLFSPDSRYFAFISGEPVNLKVWDIERQQILIDAPIAPQSSTDLVVDRQDARDKVAPRADQPWAEFMRSLQKINALQTTKKPIPGSPYMESPISANRGYKIGISNDSRMIAIRGPDANLHAWDLGTCQQIAVSLDASDRNRMRGDVAGVSYVWEFNSEQFRDVSDDEYTQNSSLPNSKLNRFVADSRRFWPIKSTLLIGDSMVNQTLWRFHGEFGWLSISPDCNWLLAVDKSSIVSVYHVPRLLPPLDDDAVRTHYMLESSEEYWAKPRGGWLEELSSFTMRQSEIAMLELANSAFESQNWFGTIFHYRRLCTRFPDDSTFHYRLGCAYSCNGQWSLAVVCFQRTVQLNPTDSDVMSNLLLAKLAEIRLVASNESEPTASHDAAIATEMQKLLIQLDDSATAVTIANVVDVAVLLDSAQIDKQLQLKWANRLVQLSPESSYYRELQGAALLRVSKYEEAFESLDESLQLSKKEAEWPPSDILTGRAIYGALTTHAFYALLKKASGVDSYVNQQVTIMKIEESERLHALDPYGKERFSIKWAQRARRTIVQDEVKRKCGGRDSAIKEMLNEILQKLPEVR